MCLMFYREGIIHLAYYIYNIFLYMCILRCMFKTSQYCEVSLFELVFIFAVVYATNDIGLS